MPAPLRALTAALIVALASLGGALYLGHERSVRGVDLANGDGVASIDLHDFLARSQAGDQTLLGSAFRKVEDAYYKPVTAQLLIDGERKELLAALKLHGVHNASLPTAVATGDQAHDTAILSHNLQLAETNYGHAVASNTATANTLLTQSAIRGMMSSLGDPYTTYLSPAEITSLEESLRGGDFGGIGVYIVQDPRTKQVLIDPIEGTPAFKAGLKPGDVIDTVDNTAVSGLKLDDVERLIRGKIGTVVVLSVHPHAGGKPRRVSVTREQIQVPSVHAEIRHGFEYVRLADFGSTSYEEVRKAMLNGKDHHVRGYILDLRNNGGGLLDAAVQISSLFVPQGAIVSTIDRYSSRDTKDALHDAIGATPLVLLVNKYTASASEITAGAVQDYKVGTLIGTKTFGKGVVQSIYNMADGGALKITTARYVTPRGRDIQHKGIEPDIVVDQPADLPIIATTKDLQLAAAESYLRRVAHR